MNLKSHDIQINMSEEYDYIEDYKTNILPEREKNSQENTKRKQRMT